MCFFIILITLIIRPPAHSLIILQDKKPFISYLNGKYALNLPESMKFALKKFNPDFEQWKTEDYTSAVLKDVMDDGNPDRAPFALIVDANQDNIPDVIIDGHDKKNSLLLCLISDREDFRVISIEENAFYIPSEIINFTDGKMETGLNYFLWPAEPGAPSDSTGFFIFTLGFPQQTNGDGELMNDGGIIDYYFENGSFRADREIL
ncbi:MAG: hypothetical protein ACM34J_12005 [Ignavibacteria bacterium]